MPALTISTGSRVAKILGYPRLVMLSPKQTTLVFGLAQRATVKAQNKEMYRNRVFIILFGDYVDTSNFGREVY